MEYDLDRPYAIIGDHFIVYDPRSIGDHFQFQDRVHSNDRSNMIFEHDRRKGCVESIVSDGPDWTEGGPKVDRGRTRLWLFWG